MVIRDVLRLARSLGQVEIAQWIESESSLCAPARASRSRRRRDPGARDEVRRVVLHAHPEYACHMQLQETDGVTSTRNLEMFRWLEREV